MTVSCEEKVMIIDGCMISGTVSMLSFFITIYIYDLMVCMYAPHRAVDFEW